MMMSSLSRIAALICSIVLTVAASYAVWPAAAAGSSEEAPTKYARSASEGTQTNHDGLSFWYLTQSVRCDDEAEADESESSILYRLRTPSEKRFLRGHPDCGSRDRGGQDGVVPPSDNTAHEAIESRIDGSTSAVLRKLDEIVRLISGLDSDFEIELFGFKLKLDLLVCSLTLTFLITLTFRIELVRRREKRQIEQLRTELKKDLDAIKKCACGRRGCDGGCAH
jgi:hypothetical protein